MSCTKINNGFVCSGTVSIEKLTLKDGSEIWFEDHKNFGPFFWLDEDCMRSIDWWDNEELVSIVDNHYKPNKETLGELL